MIIIANHSLAITEPRFRGWQLTCTRNANVLLEPNVCYRLVTPASLGSSYLIQKSAADQNAFRWTLKPVIPPPPAPARPILNVCDPLPTGHYRICSYNGKYLLTMSLDNGKVYITRQMQRMDLC
jgi:hypothetical protein